MGRILVTYRTHAHPDERDVQLPPLPDARAVVIDQLGAWPEYVKHDNRKIL